MRKGNSDLSWFSRISGQHVLEIDARMETLEYEARESAGRIVQVSENIRELQAVLMKHISEAEKLRSDVARISKQLAWISGETQKTGTAIFERVKALEEHFRTAHEERDSQRH